MPKTVSSPEIAPGVFNVSGMQVIRQSNVAELKYGNSWYGAERAVVVGLSGLAHSATLHATGSGYNYEERPLCYDLCKLISSEKEDLQLGRSSLGAAYSILAWDMKAMDDGVARRDINIDCITPYFCGIRGLERCLDTVNLHDPANIPVVERILRKLEARIRTARRLETHRLGAYVSERRGSIWATRHYYRGSYDTPAGGHAALLLGLGIRNAADDQFGRSADETVAVVRGTDGKPYIWEERSLHLMTSVPSPARYSTYHTTSRYQAALTREDLRRYHSDDTEDV